MMMFRLAESLIRWWKNASLKSRWVAGIFAFSVLATVGLFVIPDSTNATGSSAAYGTASGLDSTPWFYLDALIKLIFVIGLIIGCMVIYRHYSKKQPFGKPNRQLEVIETTRLSPRQALHLIRAGEQIFLVGATDQSISLIATLSQNNEEVKDKEVQEIKSAPFESILASISSPKE
jgi:flagellar biosynthetic protein FliO